jgi:hypothetical protein
MAIRNEGFIGEFICGFGAQALTVSYLPQRGIHVKAYIELIRTCLLEAFSSEKGLTFNHTFLL